jgi:quaternary ammonium compound-resistance protein SugE
MAWIVLVFAGLCEVGFTTCLGYSHKADGWQKYAWLGGFAVFAVLSFVLLNKASGQIPLGTAYAVWTGIGALGTVLVGIFIFEEPLGFSRLFFLIMLIGSILGLKWFAK